MEKKGNVDYPHQTPNCLFGDLKHPQLLEYKNLKDCICSLPSAQHILREELKTIIVTITSIYRVPFMSQTPYKRILFHFHFTNKETNSQKIQVTGPKSYIQNSNLSFSPDSSHASQGFPAAWHPTTPTCFTMTGPTPGSLQSICILRSFTFKSQTPYLTLSQHIILCALSSQY